MGAQEPCIRLRETQCLWLLSAASSPSPHYLWEPQLHKGKGQSGQTKAMNTTTPDLFPLASALEAQPLSFCT